MGKSPPATEKFPSTNLYSSAKSANLRHSDRNGFCPIGSRSQSRQLGESFMNASEMLEVTIDNSQVSVSPELLDKYNQPGPRYTSYPTAPEWDDTFGAL